MCKHFDNGFMLWKFLYKCLSVGHFKICKIETWRNRTTNQRIRVFDSWFATKQNWPHGDFYTEVRIAADNLRYARNKIIDDDSRKAS